MEMMEFLTVIMIAFAVVMILAGLFTTYFGTGRGRTIGLVILAAGIIVGGVWIWLTGFSNIDAFDIKLFDVLQSALINFIGILIGALVAVGIFLVGVMKS